MTSTRTSARCATALRCATATLLLVLAGCSQPGEPSASPASSTAPPPEAAPTTNAADATRSPAVTAPTTAPEPPSSPAPESAGSPGTASAAGPVEVEIVDFAFAPERVEVAVGEPVEWRNGDQANHTVKLDGVESSGTLGNGDTFSHTFAEPTTASYFCEIHSFMTGTVVVSG